MLQRPIHTKVWKASNITMGRGHTLYLTIRFTLSIKCVCGGSSFHAVQWKQRRLCLMKVKKYVRFKSYWSDHSKLAMLSWKVSSQWSSIAKLKLFFLKLYKWTHAILIMLVTSSNVPIKKGLNQIMCKGSSKGSFMRLIRKSSWLQATLFETNTTITSFWA